MYCTPLSFPLVYQWFQGQNRFKYLCLFVSSYNSNDIDIVEAIYKHKIQINKITGPDICFLFFTSHPIRLNDKNLDFMLYQVNEYRRNQQLDEFTRREIRCGVGLETNILVSDDVCKEFKILRSDLPAFIFIEKDNYYQPLIYSVKTYEDFDNLLKPINIVNTIILDLNNLDVTIKNSKRLLAIRKELDIISKPAADIPLETVLSNIINIVMKNGGDEILKNNIIEKPKKCRRIIYETLPNLRIDRELSKYMKQLKHAIKSLYNNREEHKNKLQAAFDIGIKQHRLPSSCDEINEIIKESTRKRLKLIDGLIDNLSRYIHWNPEAIRSEVSKILDKRIIQTELLKELLKNCSLDQTSVLKSYKVFIAGSKILKTQRILLRGVLMEIQVLWNVIFQAKTYEDFPRSLTTREDGIQGDYNGYIVNEVDIVVFVIDGLLGGITEKEFNIAYETMINNKGIKPEIYVFYREKNDEPVSCKIEKIKNKLNEIKQYYIEYHDNEDLCQKFKEQINQYLVRKK